MSAALAKANYQQGVASEHHHDAHNGNDHFPARDGQRFKAHIA